MHLSIQLSVFVRAKTAWIKEEHRVKIVPLDRQDRAVVQATAQLYSRVFAELPWNEVWSAEATLQIVCNPLPRWWVARDEYDQVVGFVAGCVMTLDQIITHFDIPRQILCGNRIGYKAELGVAPELRRVGLARLLTAKLLDWFKKQDIDQFLVRTRPGTGNHPWYSQRLNHLHTYDDERMVFGTSGIPTL